MSNCAYYATPDVISISIVPSYCYRPLHFFVLVFLLSWLPWALAACYSYHPDHKGITLLFALLGLFGPCFAALIMIVASGNQELIQDCKQRLLRISSIRATRVLYLLVIILLTLLLATWLSVQMGNSINQLLFSSGFIDMLPIALVAAILEELGWRTYGVDSLRAHMGMMSATLCFSGLWALWHLPLFFMIQTYQNNLWHMGGLYVANFFISIIPAAILSNWFYYKCKRSIPAAIFFHFTLVATAELLQTEPFTKCIFTVLLFIICVLMIVNDRSFFFSQ